MKKNILHYKLPSGKSGCGLRPGSAELWAGTGTKEQVTCSSCKRSVVFRKAVVQGAVLAPEDLVYPCCGSLPMVFTWSLYFCQALGRPVAHLVCAVLWR